MCGWVWVWVWCGCGWMCRLMYAYVGEWVWDGVGGWVGADVFTFDFN